MTHDNINQDTYNRIGTTAIIIRHKEAGRYSGVHICGTKICQKMVFKYFSPKNSKKSASGSF